MSSVQVAPGLYIATDWFPMTQGDIEGWTKHWDHEQKVEYLRSKGIKDPEQHWSVQPEKKDED